MTFPLYEDDNPQDLGYDAKWKIIGDFIDYSITEGISQSALATHLRNTGFRFGNTPFNQLWQSLADFRVRFEYPSSIPDDLTPNVDLMATSNYLPSGTYQYTAYASWWNSDLETFQEKYFKVNSTDLYNKLGAIDALWGFASNNYGISAENIDEFYYIGSRRGVA